MNIKYVDDQQYSMTLDEFLDVFDLTLVVTLGGVYGKRSRYYVWLEDRRHKCHIETQKGLHILTAHGETKVDAIQAFVKRLTRARLHILAYPSWGLYVPTITYGEVDEAV